MKINNGGSRQGWVNAFTIDPDYYYYTEQKSKHTDI